MVVVALALVPPRAPALALSDSPLVWDFEGDSLCPWTATGSAWGVTDRDRAGRHGRQHAESLCGGEAATGVLRSPPFTIDGPFLTFLLHGWSGNDQIGRNCVRLIRQQDGAVLREAAPPGSDAFVAVRWDVRSFLGESVFLEATDEAAGDAYAWLGIDDVRVLSAPLKRAGRERPVLTDLSDDRLVLETRYYRLEFNRRTGRFDRCFLDVTGAAPRFDPNIFGETGGMGFADPDPPKEGDLYRVELIPQVGRWDVTIFPFHRPAGLATLALTADPDSPALGIEIGVLPSPGPKRDLGGPAPAPGMPADTQDTFLISLDDQVSPTWVFYGGRKARVAHDGRPDGLLADSSVPVAGVLDKEDPNLCLRLEWDHLSASAVCGTLPGLGVAGFALPVRGPGPVSLSVRLIPGMPDIEGPTALLRDTFSTAEPAAETFVFWLSHVANVRDFSGHLLQATAAHLADFDQAWLTDAYSNCWTRDVAYGWRSGIYVAGPAMLQVMRDEIEVLGSAHNDRGWSPTGVSPKLDFFYGNLDSMAHLINMTYDYYAKTGDDGFLAAQVPNLRRQGDAILSLIDGSGLPSVPPGGDIWPDLGRIQGHQTYLTALSYGALRNLSRLLQFAGETGNEPYGVAAGRVMAAASRPVSQGGLWDPSCGAFIAWRQPDGATHPPDTHGNLTAVLTGLCPPERVPSVFAALDAHRAHIYEGGMTPLSYSVEPSDHTLRQWLPWIAGLDIAARARWGDPRAADTYRLLLHEYRRAPFPFREASVSPNDPVHGGNSGRVWDSWSLLYALYNAHFGIDLTPGHIRVHPSPLLPIHGQEVKGLRWQNKRYDLRFAGSGPFVTGVRFEGQNLPSCILPACSGRAEIRMGQVRRHPLLLDAPDGMRLHNASWARRTLCLSLEPLTAHESLTVFWPSRLGPPTVAGLQPRDRYRYDRRAESLTITLTAPLPRTLQISPAPP